MLRRPVEPAGVKRTSFRTAPKSEFGPKRRSRLSRVGLCLIGEPRQQLLHLTRIVAQAAPLAVR